jgi:hypothetical protein
VIHFQVATPLKKSVKYIARSNPCGLLEILGEEALTGIQFLFQLKNLTFVFLLVFALSDALVCLINLVIWRHHFKNKLTTYFSRRNSRLVGFHP